MTDDHDVDLTPVAKLRARFQGAVLGLAVADALATPAQWMRNGHAEPIRDLRGGGPHDLPRGAWRADTAMAWCTAASLLDCARHDPQDELARLRSWQREGAYSATGECIGITAAVAHVLSGAKPTADGFDAQVRAVPITLFYFGRDAVRDSALVGSVALTAHEPATLDEVNTLAHILNAALRGDEAAWAREWARPMASTSHSMFATLRELLNGHAGWKETALAAANLGGEAHGVPALAGALAGARFGVQSIPQAWRETIAHAESLSDVADRLLIEALVGVAELA